MTVRIRFARFGCRHRPFYRVVVANSRTRRDGKQLEVLGHYNPLPGKDGGDRMGLKVDRIKYWLSVGAQPSEPVRRILSRAGVFPPIDPLTGCFVTPAKSTDADQLNNTGGDENDANEDAPSALNLGTDSSLWCNIGVQFPEADFN
ncbi:30S ribosomal protein S16-like [Thalictrum thalictroides]|uniref:30S ribosomal protein S16-like n=1 Tax=Thalictrum thalictroides TaxID=46969 RepID=A0A7J6UW47_THATH|nr:30S ribosomal protein S16-like [Thalictrum thalictroides]